MGCITEKALIRIENGVYIAAEMITLLSFITEYSGCLPAIIRVPQ